VDNLVDNLQFLLQEYDKMNDRETVIKKQALKLFV